MARVRREITMARCAGSALLAAIEIYNKPTVEYRDQTFAVLITNAWEILLKARIVQQSGGKLTSIYLKKERRYVRDTVTKDPLTISLRQALSRVALPGDVSANIRGLLAVRNAAAHLGVLNGDLANRTLAFGAAGVYNFVDISNDWFGETIKAPPLLPVGFLGSATLAKGGYSNHQKELLKRLNELANGFAGDENSKYSVVLYVKVNLNRSLSGGGTIGMTNSPSAPKVKMTDDEALDYYTANYDEIIKACSDRYPEFKRDNRFHGAMAEVKADATCAYERRLDPDNPKSAKKFFYRPETTLAKLDEILHP